jgi:hypothetical protein
VAVASEPEELQVDATGVEYALLVVAALGIL